MEKIKSMDNYSIALLQESFQLIKIDDEFVKSFYDCLFKLEPETEAMFSGDESIRAKTLSKVFDLFILGLRNPLKMKPTLENLGRNHYAKGVRVAHFQFFENAIIITIASRLGDAFTPELEQALSKYLHVISLMMNEHMLRSKDADDAGW